MSAVETWLSEGIPILMRFISRFLTSALSLGILGSAAAAPATAPKPFTIDSVMQSLKKTYPHATRVADTLPAGVAAKENVTFAERTTGALQLDLYRPTGYKSFPAVLIVHGGGWIAGDRTMERPFAKQLAALG
ncbi:MAG TPA: hypothetical protein VFT72_18525 [Opitutaceae bacterium]|nr:hypothetical protein [Opitutaceae bacterium]